MKPYLDDGDLRLYHGEALTVLQTLPAGSVHCIVTSPPYWGLRDYGTGEWTGGDAICDHEAPPARTASGFNARYFGKEFASDKQGAKREVYRNACGRCGARRVDDQLGLEPTPHEYVTRLVAILREARRVLRADGTCWLNLGDSYAGSWGNQGRKPERGSQRPINGEMLTPVLDGRYPDKGSNTGAVPDGLKPKDLVGVPWRVAFALQDDGWYLRSDVIWSKPNPMPESVTDRPTRSHEYVFLLTKSARYFYDADAIREPYQSSSIERAQYGRDDIRTGVVGHLRDGMQKGVSKNGAPSRDDLVPNAAGRNRRSVWQIATQPYPEAHFATFPEDLVRPCILAGTSEAGCCAECGAPHRRALERESRPNWAGHGGQKHDGTYYRPNIGGGVGNDRRAHVDHGWEPSCSHDAPTKPCVVLDPFIGSGTTALVARKHDRRSIGIDLSQSYLELAARRLQQQSLFAVTDGG